MYISKDQSARELKDALYIRVLTGLDTTPQILRSLLQCSDKNTIHVFYSEHGLPIAYMAYALISKQTLYMLSEHKLEYLRDYELDEGKILYIMDMVITKDHSRLAGHIMKAEIFKKRLICGTKNKEFKIYKKQNKKFKRVRLLLADTNKPDKKLSLLSYKQNLRSHIVEECAV